MLDKGESILVQLLVGYLAPVILCPISKEERAAKKTPGLGHVLAAGALVSWIVGALEGAIVVGGLSAVGTGLYRLGIPKDSILRYETELKTGTFVLIAHGSAVDISHAKETSAAPGRRQWNTSSDYIGTYHQTGFRVMNISSHAGKPAKPSMLVRVPELVTAYYTMKPDPRFRNNG